ncbi:hypothetical protein BRO54_2712 [Geobacillus proteiniphilus]|uniref:Uncharacterized protein n=1 Tax=Geobacillus proteiniphilus TaxID=860353 RepID=A0A1Q5SU84_9BACL|nr:hypothetical protein BRO54_2712 [Geobacillus proteiniphilus]
MAMGFVLLLFMLVILAVSTLCEVWAAGNSAWFLWSVWHEYHSNKKEP